MGIGKPPPADRWGVTRTQLVSAVKEVGVSVAALAKKLGKKT